MKSKGISRICILFSTNMLIYVLFLFIYREIGEFMDKNLLYNSRPFGRCKLKCLKETL